MYLKKQQLGQDFPDLDLTTSLLQPHASLDATLQGSGERNNSKRHARMPPSIEVLHSEENDGEGSDDEEAEKKEACKGKDESVVPSVREGAPTSETDSATATVDDPIAATVLTPTPHYGFNQQYSGVFHHLRDEMAEVLQLPDPEQTPEALRTEVCIHTIGKSLSCIYFSHLHSFIFPPKCKRARSPLVIPHIP